MTDLLIDDGICKGIKAVRRNEDGSGETEELEIYGENTILQAEGSADCTGIRRIFRI